MSELTRQIRELEKRHDEAVQLAGEVVATLVVNMKPGRPLTRQMDEATALSFGIKINVWRNRLDALRVGLPRDEA